ncbi:MAG: hypothetical protein H6673_05825 [Anaerolineales bacterium]|nr:hypothetical protein [Anaerolineales bacterium]
MVRGGSWNNNQDNARAAVRNNNNPNNRNNNRGFRVVASAHVRLRLLRRPVAYGRWAVRAAPHHRVTASNRASRLRFAGCGEG